MINKCYIPMLAFLSFNTFTFHIQSSESTLSSQQQNLHGQGCVNIPAIMGKENEA